MQTAVYENAAKDGKITELRTLLAEKFPQTAIKPGGVLAMSGESGLPELKRGVITEVSGAAGSVSLFLDRLIASAQAAETWMALVDGACGFDPARGDNRRLLWVMCRNAAAAVKSADLLLRDGNLALVVLDLQMNPEKELRRIPPTTWYRFQRIVEPSASAFVVLSARPMVGSAAERLELRGRWTLRAMLQHRAELRLPMERVTRRALVAVERQTA